MCSLLRTGARGSLLLSTRVQEANPVYFLIHFPKNRWWWFNHSSDFIQFLWWSLFCSQMISCLFRKVLVDFVATKMLTVLILNTGPSALLFKNTYFFFFNAEKKASQISQSMPIPGSTNRKYLFASCPRNTGNLWKYFIERRWAI